MAEDERGLLGICIPTYNRAETIKERLELYEPYIEKYGIHIYICDNASKDNTAEVVEKYKDNPNIHYKRNERNLGYDRNATLALRMCKEKYSWLTGDDDYFNTDIEAIENILKSESPDVLHLNYGQDNEKLIFTEPKEIFYNLMYGFSTMGSLIISTSIIKELDFERYYDLAFVHAGALMDYILCQGKAKVCVLNSKSWIIMKNTITSSFTEWNIFGVRCKCWIETLTHLPSITYEDIQLQIKTSTPYLFNNARLLQQRALGTFSLNALRKYGHWIRFYRNGPSPILYAISVFPIPVARAICKAYRSIKKMPDILE